MVKSLANEVCDSDEQLALRLPRVAPRYDEQSFLISDANDAAWRCLDAWRSSAEPAVVVCGPPSSGKTHLAHITVNRLDGVFADAAKGQVDFKSVQCIAFDNLPTGDPRRFLSHIEELMAVGKRLILVGSGRPAEWAEGLIDLQTRLEAMPRATLSEPDEALMRTVIAKSFLDRQVIVDQRVIDYAAPRLPRTFEAAQRFVTQADELALKSKRKISTSLVQKLINDLTL